MVRRQRLSSAVDAGATRVAFQGEPGAYSEEAVTAALGEGDRFPCRTLREVFAAVETGEAGAGIVPVENSFAGSVNDTYDFLLASTLHIVGEVQHRVEHCLLALPGETLTTVERVLSHPQALAQCEAFIHAQRLEPIAEYDTAGAARRVAVERLTRTAAVASRRAGQLYGLDILAESIQTAPLNLTRFLVLARDPAPVAVDAKTSIVFGTANVPGALYKALGVFAHRSLNLSKLESRPAQERIGAPAAGPWEYLFYVDVEAHATAPAMAEALAELQDVTTFLRILGSYPRAFQSPPSLTPADGLSAR